MTESKHTPGPWEFAPSAVDRDTWRIWASVKYEDGAGGWYMPLIATTGSGTDARDGAAEQAEANARLIAAAPETAAELDRQREINAELLSVLGQVQQSCLFEDDNGQIGVSEDVTITSWLFSEICRVLKQAKAQSHE